MSFLARLLKKFRPLELEDSFFEHVTYMKMPSGRTSFWEARRLFIPTGREIELFIDAPAPEQLPNEMQREFYSSVAAGFNQLSAAAESILRPKFEEWSRQPLLYPFDVEFTLASFSIPCASLDAADWEMSFESKTDQNHLFSVAFAGRTAIAVSILG